MEMSAWARVLGSLARLREFVPAACADIPEIPVRNSGILEIIRDFLLAGFSRVILP